MAALTETVHASEFVLWEANPEYNRENYTLAVGQNLKAGTLLAGPTTAMVRLTASNTAGTLAAATIGILLADVDATDAAQPAAIMARGPALVNGNSLTYPVDIGGGSDSVDESAVSLALLGIIVRS